MQRFRVWWNSFKTVAILLSFILNLVLIIVVLLLLMQIFQIKNGILEPLIDGLHSSFVGLDEATIIRTIQVEDEIPVVFDLPLNQRTNVVLVEDVRLDANATFTLPGGGGMINGRVDIVLPRDLVLPVQLNMIVPVDTQIPVNLAVDVEIPLNETELHAPFVNLRDLLEPYVRILDHLPDGWDEVPDFTIDAIQGDGINLLAPSEDSANPWPRSSGQTGESDGGETGDATATPVTSNSSGSNGNGESQETVWPTATPFSDMGIITPSQ
ncbi:MAG: hypothetical protein GXY36_07305 [Chloroflexi bacterium]|jgi:hypothetical protein|nr:hypothetical protein [Chloroflexota bacterium]